MTVLTIDTHSFFNELKQTGLSDQQAEVITKLHQQTANAAIEFFKHEHNADDLTTKHDLRELELKLDARIKETDLKIELLRSELKKDLAETKAELIRWVVGVGLLQTTLVAALLLKVVGNS